MAKVYFQEAPQIGSHTLGSALGHACRENPPVIALDLSEE